MTDIQSLKIVDIKVGSILRVPANGREVFDYGIMYDWLFALVTSLDIPGQIEVWVLDSPLPAGDGAIQKVSPNGLWLLPNDVLEKTFEGEFIRMAVAEEMPEVKKILDGGFIQNNLALIERRKRMLERQAEILLGVESALRAALP